MTSDVVIAGIIVDRSSSLITRVTSDIGVEITWDGISRVYVTVQSHWSGKTRGLCGNFNKNQDDDFTTIENNIETDVALFGESWKLDPSCKSVNKHHAHPCTVHVQRASEAERMCNILKKAPFTKCHHVVNIDEGYLQSCKYDVCGCQDGTKCLCSAIASYTHDCARQGVEIVWRNPSTLPECSKYCSTDCRIQNIIFHQMQLIQQYSTFYCTRELLRNTAFITQNTTMMISSQ